MDPGYAGAKTRVKGEPGKRGEESQSRVLGTKVDHVCEDHRRGQVCC